MRKKDLIKEFQSELNLNTYKEAEFIYNHFMNKIKKTLIEDKKIKLEDIGILKIIHKKERVVKVPLKNNNIDDNTIETVEENGKKMQVVKVPSKIGVKFEINKFFEKELNSNK